MNTWEPLPSEALSIKLYKASAKAGRMKLSIPYEMAAERAAFKKLDSSFYHPQQRLWSLMHTKANLDRIRALFGDKLKEIETHAPKRLPEVVLSEAVEAEVQRCFQKLVLKSYSHNTVKN